MGSGSTQDLVVTKVTLGKERYHQQEEIVRWCKQNLGPGGWNRSLVLNATGDLWRVDSMFGSTMFWFKDERHYLLFCLKWL